MCLVDVVLGLLRGRCSTADSDHGYSALLDGTALSVLLCCVLCTSHQQVAACRAEYNRRRCTSLVGLHV